ncbi:MAG: hypothetical protein ABEI77_07565 [Halorientalis sp.]
MGDWLPSSKPTWWSVIETYSYTLKRFLKDPQGYIWGFIALYIISTILKVTRWAGSFLKTLFKPFETIFNAVVTALTTVLNPLKVILEAGVGTYLSFVDSLALATGPLAPFVVLLVHGAVLYGLVLALGKLSRYVGLGSFYSSYIRGRFL